MSQKINVVSDVVSAVYHITGLNKFDVNEILSLDSFVVADKKKGEKEVRDKILSLEWMGDVLVCNFKFGNDNLRPDAFTEKVLSLYGGERVTVIKKDALFSGGKTLKEFIGK